MTARTYISPDCAKQWEVLLLLLSSEEKNIDRTTENEIDTMNYFYNNEGVKKIMLQWLHEMNLSYARKTSESDTALKCNQVSFLWRQQGNDKYHANLIDESYQCYSKSVIYANQNDTEYALALANRSAALLRLKRFKECLADIDLSIASGYKREMLHKLLLRKADCYIELNQMKNSQASILSASEHAISLKLSASQMAEFERHVRLLERKINTGENTHSLDEYNVVLPECLNGVNPEFNAASLSIELKNNDTVGRHVIAKEALKRGDVLFSEEPYAWVTLPSEDPVCEMCCQTDINPLPCSSCSRSVYCSEACRSTAFAMFHKWECVGAQSDLFPTIGIAHLALRVLLISHYHGLPTPMSLAKPTACELFKSYSQVDKIDIYRAKTPDFYRMFNLVTNFDKMNNNDYIQYAVTATMLILYLERFTSFFDTFELGPLNERERKRFAAAFMLRCMGQLVCNGHAALSLSTYDDGTGRTVTEREVRRATAIYPSAAMMNHSCDPNIINTFYKNRLIIRCARELSAGAEVFNCYGPHRAREPTAQRRAHLRAQYMFQCMCSACADGDQQQFADSYDSGSGRSGVEVITTSILLGPNPDVGSRNNLVTKEALVNTKVYIEMLFTAYACQSCKGPVLWQGKKAHCQHCNAEFFPEKALAILDRAEELAFQAIEAKTPQEGCERMQASYRLKQQVWYRHHASLRAAADKLAKSYADAGEFSKSVELIKQNIQSLEYQYGSFSVEVAHELRKLSDVMLERILNAPRNSAYREWCLETHKIVRKAIQLTELNYGGWEPLVRRLVIQERVVGDLVQDTAAGLSQTDNIHHILHYNLKI